MLTSGPKGLKRVGSVQYYITGYYQSQFVGFSKQNYYKKIHENQRKNIKIDLSIFTS